MTQPPRPDQRVTGTAGAVAGVSRSGSGELAGALGYPGVPAAVPNCQGVTLSQVGPGAAGTIITFPQSGRLWLVILSYVITSNGSFTPPTVRTVATVRATTTAALTLATIQLGVAGANQHDSDTVAITYPGLPLTKGETLTLAVNGGTVVTNLDQQASVSVLYSIP